MMKVWETESFSLDFQTGELKRVVTEHFFLGVNLEQAYLSLVKTNMPWLRLTGNSYNEKPNMEVETEISEEYESFVSPQEVTQDMTLDDFYDWLDLFSEEVVNEHLEEFKKYKHYTHIPIIEGYIKHKYGSKD